MVFRTGLTTSMLVFVFINKESFSKIIVCLRKKRFWFIFLTALNDYFVLIYF